MKNSITDLLRQVAAKVKKGDIRNTILRQVKVLQNATDLLTQGKVIKKQEIQEYKEKKPDKVRKLKNQISIITRGLRRIKEAITELQAYKKTSVS